MSSRSRTPSARQLPWQQLKSETLRLVCKDLKLPASRRDDMCKLLEEVDANGLDSVLKTVEDKKRKAQEAGLDDASSTKKPRKGPTSAPSVGRRTSSRATGPEGPATRRTRSTNSRSKRLEGVVLTTSRRARSSGSAKKAH